MPITPDDVQDVEDDIEDVVEDTEQNIGDFVANRPLVALGIAALFGFVLARTIF